MSVHNAPGNLPKSGPKGRGPSPVRNLVVWPSIFFIVLCATMYGALVDAAAEDPTFYEGGLQSMFLGFVCFVGAVMFAMFVGLPLWLCGAGIGR